MKKIVGYLLAILGSIIITAMPSYADVPYCDGTKKLGEKKNAALQNVVAAFAQEYNCKADSPSCLGNYEKIKYNVSWSKPCSVPLPFLEHIKLVVIKSLLWFLGADPTEDDNIIVDASTFTCSDGTCQPLNFSSPTASYDIKEDEDTVLR